MGFCTVMLITQILSKMDLTRFGNKVFNAELYVIYPVSKVVNKYGPQTRPALVSVPAVRPGVKRARSPPPASGGPTQSVTGVEERLHNMESFLKMKSSKLILSIIQHCPI